MTMQMGVDLIDVYISGLTYEVARELREGEDALTPAQMGEKIEVDVLAALSHECQLVNFNLLRCVEQNMFLRPWYETNENRYSDYFLEMMPHVEPYVSNPEAYANIWGNLTSQIIGAVYGNIREEMHSGQIC